MSYVHFLSFWDAFVCSGDAVAAVWGRSVIEWLLMLKKCIYFVLWGNFLMNGLQIPVKHPDLTTLALILHPPPFFIHSVQ